MLKVPFRLLIPLTVGLILGASQASAQLCDILRTIEPDQRALAQALETDAGNAGGPAVQNQLTRTIDKATALTEFNVTSTSLKAEIAAYDRQMRAVNLSRQQHGPSSAITRLQSDTFQRSVRTLAAAGRAYCDRSTGANVSGTTSRDAAMGRLTNLSWKVGAPILLIATVILGATAYLVHSRITLREARRARFDCKIPITIEFDTHKFDTHLIDISAIGAKISIPADCKIADKALIRVDGQQFRCAKAWDNRHFAGFTFHPPLRLSLVKKWASTRQTKWVAKDTFGSSQDA